MYKITTFFIKAQLPGLTTDYLLDSYKNEIQQQSTTKVTIDSATITFANDNIMSTATSYSNRYSNFSNGRIDVEETDDEFIVHLEASLVNLFIKPGLVAGIAPLFILFFKWLCAIYIFTWTLCICIIYFNQLYLDEYFVSYIFY
jgi:hypothetical protein